MVGNDLSRLRRRVGFGLTTLIAAGMAWAATPGLPVLWAPRASAEEKAKGMELFEHEWTPHDPIAKGDGLGPVFNGRSCVACHFQGGVGGGGNNQHNVVSFELMPTRERPLLKGGLIHAFAVENKFTEKLGTLRTMYPIIPGCVKLEGNCQVLIHDFDPIRTESVNSTALFGAGWVDRISGKTIYQHGLRKSVAKIGQELTGEFGGVMPGRPRVLADGRVGKFGWKAQFATLEEFVAAACANEIGLGNPRMEQARPIGHDYPDMEADLDRTQFRQLVAFVDTLPRPTLIEPSDPTESRIAKGGEASFAKVGCASCHTPEMSGVEGVYSDFLLHRLDDLENRGSGYQTVSTPEVPLPHAFPLPEEWKTPPLWGVADSAPYFHDGGSATLEAAIARHHGDAQAVLDLYRSLPGDEKAAIVAFLKTLKAPVEAKPADLPPSRTIASAR
ncbi:di-heme oxidoredictase family protein [Tundrisphaera lichenicola]|uniref:di-heme oxidoredictase family protein n=1 Tax=Tundrisphaera lichenicola TaxID=2029860 RepID=UPI003EB9F7A8